MATKVCFLPVSDVAFSMMAANLTWPFLLHASLLLFLTQTMHLRRREADVVLGWSRDGRVPNSTMSANLLTGHLRLMYDSFSGRCTVIA